MSSAAPTGRGLFTGNQQPRHDGETAPSHAVAVIHIVVARPEAEPHSESRINDHRAGRGAGTRHHIGRDRRERVAD
jgi:hypothetical protein